MKEGKDRKNGELGFNIDFVKRSQATFTSTKKWVTAKQNICTGKSNRWLEL